MRNIKNKKIVSDKINGLVYSNLRYKQINKLLHKIRLKINNLVFEADVSIDDARVLRLKNFIRKINKYKIYNNTKNKYTSYKDDTNYMM